MSRIPLSQLSEATIRGRTKSGDTPLHRTTKTGKFDEIPKHLLQIELFLAKNNREDLPWSEEKLRTIPPFEFEN
jgi:hypothetical protein